MIDGAHKEPEVTGEARTGSERFGQQSVNVIFAVLADKQHQQMIQTLGALPNVQLRLTQFEGPNANVQRPTRRCWHMKCQMAGPLKYLIIGKLP